MTPLKYITIYALCVISFSAHAATPSEELSAKLQAINTFTATFEQRIFDKTNAPLQQTEGKVIVKNPGKFYWSVKPPFEQLVVTNGSKLWVYDPDMEQVTVYQKDQLDATPAQILSGDFTRISTDYTVSKQALKKGEQSYVMAPLKATPNGFESLKFVFNSKNILSAMVLTDKLEQRTEVKFSKQTANKPVKDQQFDFVPPDGVDVIASE
ncbi:outer membrane lipoprotein carrier protein [Alteromonadaceae bacterium 2753L.S.0a.02]|nr:outer membrane lipoprotein carrier protein [Alteromonadaceae bacterium 2753L.S.0a.02]